MLAPLRPSIPLDQSNLAPSYHFAFVSVLGTDSFLYCPETAQCLPRVYEMTVLKDNGIYLFLKVLWLICLYLRRHLESHYSSVSL